MTEHPGDHSFVMLRVLRRKQVSKLNLDHDVMITARV